MGSELVGYLVLVLLGIVLTVIVAGVLWRSGKSLLDGVYPRARAESLSRLVTVGYLLVALGILAIISTIDLPVEGVVQTLVTKLGVILLVLGGAYALTLKVFGKLRDARREEELDEDYHQAVRRDS